MGVACGWWFAERSGRGPVRSTNPNWLYALQVGPFFLALMMVAGFTVPAFLRFEPRVASEEFGPPVLILTALCLVLLGAGCYRAFVAYARTARLVKAWKRDAVAVKDTKVP